MFKKRLFFLIAAVGVLALLFTVACDELGTEDEDSIYTVTLNLTFPSYEELNDLPVTAYLWESVDDDLPYTSEQTLISGNTASITLDDVDEGIYAVLVDVSIDGSAGSDVMEKGDIFWGVLDVSINSDKTITLTEYYWQRFHSLLFGVQGIPSGHAGEIIAAGILPDSANWLDIEANVIWGAYTTIYSNNALVSPAPIDWESEEQWMADSLSYGEYDLFMLLDVDGQPGDYENEGPINIITPGDYYDVYDFNYQSGTDIDGPYLISATFAPVTFEGITLTVNYELPEEPDGPAIASFDSVMVKIELWHDLNDDEPARTSISPVTFPTGAITIYDVAEGTYHILVTIGDDKYQDEDTTMYEDDHKFLAWGGLNVLINADKTIDIQPEWWQFVDIGIGIGIEEIPSGYEGEMVFLGLFAEGGNLLDLEDSENFLMGGMGFIYNNSVLIAMHPTHFDFWDTTYSFELPTGSYQLVTLIDLDWDPTEFDPQDTTNHKPFIPYDVGEPVAIIDYTYFASNEDSEVQILSGTFTEMIGITGTVTCPPWNSGAGDIWVVLFENDPFNIPLEDSTDDSPISFDIIEDPGTYGLPAFPGTAGFVIGVWDANNSGMDGDPMDTTDTGGPDEGDYIGMYGNVFGQPDTVSCGASGISNINFEIDTPYNDTLLGQ